MICIMLGKGRPCNFSETHVLLQRHRADVKQREASPSYYSSLFSAGHKALWVLQSLYPLCVCVWVCISIAILHHYFSMVELCILKDSYVYDHIPCISFMAHSLVGVEKCLSMEGNITLKDL